MSLELAGQESEWSSRRGDDGHGTEYIKSREELKRSTRQRRVRG